MDYKVIYELENPTFSILYLIPIILIIVTVALLLNTLRSREKSVSNIILYSVGLILSIIVTLYVFIGSHSEYLKYSTALNNGDCLIVEGIIENYKPANIFGHETESFEVSSVKFEYGNEISYSYSYTDGFNCFDNGVKARITYYDDNGTNVILKFEINMEDITETGSVS